MKRKVHFWTAVLAGVVWLPAGRGRAQPPIERLPAIDATGSAAARPYADRLSGRTGADPLPPIGSDWQLLPPNPLPTIQRRYSYEQPTTPYPQPPAPYDASPTPYGQPSAPYARPGLPPPDLGWPGAPPKLSSHKKGFFQKLSISATWLDGGPVNDLGITELVTSLTVALPLPTEDHPLLITPNFETRLLKGPLTPDLPGEVYSAYVQFIWAPKLSERWRGIIGIEPGAYGDFQNSDADVFRLLGRGMVHFDWAPDRLEILAGILYLDRGDVKLLPAGGVIWSPTDDLRYEIVFPKPKFAWRIFWDGHAEHWIYLAGEFGGDTWAVQRASGAPDVLTLRDVRVMLGIERKLDGGAGAALEIGYVFSRVIEYESATPDVNLDDTFLIRGVLRF